jgi:hypothetical protein
MFPSAFVRVLTPIPAITAPAAPAPMGEARAEHDYQSTEPGDLSFTAGARITLLERVGTEWCGVCVTDDTSVFTLRYQRFRGRLGVHEGLFPGSFVTVTKPLP